MNTKELTKRMDNIVAQGAIVDAVKEFFADNATTSDFSGVTTANKNEMIQKMEGFAGAIAAVNGITHHHTIVDENVSASEFTFDFDMKDGSKILWHEIIRSVWENGEIVEEQYFKS